MNFWPLLGVAVVVGGFLRGYNPVLIVIAAGLVSGVVSGMAPLHLLALLGNSFVDNRALLLYALTLPAIGVLERAGLREHAARWIAGLRSLNSARLLAGYLLLRQLLSMVGLTNVAGQAQTVRPLLAPMAEAAARRDNPDLDAVQQRRVRALAAATDNVGLFFGEDVFVALGAVVLIQGFYASQGIALSPLAIALWALPTALAAFAIHGARLALWQRRLRRRQRSRADDAAG